MRAVRRAKGVVHIDVAELRQAGAERRDLRRIGGFLRAVLALHLALFLDVKAQVFEQDDPAWLEVGAGRLHLGTHAVPEGLHRLAEQLGPLLRDRLQAELFHALTVRPPEMAGQHHRPAIFQNEPDRRQGRHDALGIGDRAGDFVLRDIKIDAHKDAFTGDIDVAKREFGHDG